MQHNIIAGFVTRDSGNSV